MALVRLTLPLRQAEALAQLAEEASLETFNSCGQSRAWVEMMIEAGTTAMEALRDAIVACEQQNARAAARRRKK